MTETYTPDNLIAGDFPRVTAAVTIASGANAVRGALLGKITVGTASGEAAAGNTGDGTIGTVSTGTAAKAGVYRAVCIEPASNAGTFAVYDPDGLFVGRATAGVAFTAGPTFTIADGEADFVAGDSFTITVAAGSGKYKLSLAAATDGSQVPTAILAEAAAAASADVVAPAYLSGEFNAAAITFGTGHTAASVKDALRARNLYLQSAL